jgi:hypothetical protein
MKTKKYFLILTVFTAILCVPALGEVELPVPAEKPFLIGRAHPELADVDQLYVDIVPPDSDPNKDGLVWQELETKVLNKLRKANIRVVGNIKTVITRGFNISVLSELRVDIDMLRLDDSQQYVFRIQASVSREVRLARKSNFSFKAVVWKTEPVMQVVSVKDMPDKVTDVVLKQTEAFIHAYLAANPKTSQPADANSVSTVPKQPAKPAAQQEVTEYKFVASENSKVFHRPDCHWVKQIKPENLIDYDTRAEAIKAGKRPCKQCKP